MPELLPFNVDDAIISKADLQFQLLTYPILQSFGKGKQLIKRYFDENSLQKPAGILPSTVTRYFMKMFGLTDKSDEAYALERTIER